MPIYEFDHRKIRPLAKTTFGQAKLREQSDLQRLLRENIEVIAPDTLVIAKEFGVWDGSRRRIDLLGLDREAKLVVIELKRTEDGGHMELQAIRYAAMVSTMTFDKAVDVFNEYLVQIGKDGIHARTEILNFLRWDEPDEDAFAQDVRLVLASAEFSRELTTSVLWLIEHNIDISCVRLRPYDLDGRTLVDVQQIIPLSEAAEYQVQVREKAWKRRESRPTNSRRTKYDITVGEQMFRGESKGRAIYRIFRHLVENDIDPEEVARHCGPLANRALMSVDGEVGQGDFMRLAHETRNARGYAFDPIRWFCNDGDLVRTRGRTYAFSTQWGDPGWSEAMKELRDAFPTHRIEFSPSDRSPLSESAEYPVKVREKTWKRRESRPGYSRRTKYDIKLGGQRFRAESKQRAIYRTFRHLVEKGIMPEEVARHCGPLANRALMSVDGEVGQDDFMRLAHQTRNARGYAFDPIRWFCNDGDLVRVRGRTYAFSNQWGDPGWSEAMKELRDAFSEHGIEYSPTAG